MRDNDLNIKPSNLKQENDDILYQYGIDLFSKKQEKSKDYDSLINDLSLIGIEKEKSDTTYLFNSEVNYLNSKSDNITNVTNNNSIVVFLLFIICCFVIIIYKKIKEN